VRRPFLNITETEREAEIEPDRVADNFWWEAKAFGIGSSGVCFHAGFSHIVQLCSQVDNTRWRNIGHQIGWQLHDRADMANHCSRNGLLSSWLLSPLRTLSLEDCCFYHSSSFFSSV
jgi:hypothetical protein